MERFKKLSSIRILYLAMFSFFFVSTFAISTARLKDSLGKRLVIKNPEPVVIKDFPPVPVQTNFVLSPDITAASAFAKDIDSGISLFEKNPDQLSFPASTTKMITALTALDYYNLNEVIKISNIRITGQKMGLTEGEEISVRDLISGLLIFSANDAAEALAANYCINENCGRGYFIAAMNEKAKELHLGSTNFNNPSGLDSEGHLTTARDLAVIGAESMKNPFFRETVGTKNAVVSSMDGKTQHRLVNLNELVGEVEGVLGVKTGWTENAGENLVTYIERDGKEVVIAVLSSDDRFGDTKKLIDWVFESYKWENVRI